MPFAEKLKRLRKKNNLSQNKLAEIIGVHEKHVSRYEHGKALPSAEVLITLSKNFNISIDSLLLDENELYNDAIVINDELVSKLKHIEELSTEDRKLIIAMIETFIDQKLKRSD